MSMPCSLHPVLAGVGVKNDRCVCTKRGLLLRERPVVRDLPQLLSASPHGTSARAVGFSSNSPRADIGEPLMQCLAHNGHSINMFSRKI